MSYTQSVELNNNETLAKVNTETGEVTTFQSNKRKLPEGKSKLDYDNFSIINNNMLRVLFKECSSSEIKVILHMIYLSEFNTNSLNPLNNETSHRELGKIFDLDHKTIKTIFTHLKELGVYLQLNITEVDGVKEYWVLNPYISWKGKLKSDSLFLTFANTKIVRLL